jgi:hypothetical protein
MTERYYRWPNNDLDISQKIEHLRARAKLLEATAITLDEGPPYRETGVSCLADLYASFAGCLELFAKQLPIKRSDRVVLLKAPKCDGNWAASKHFLIEGALGTVKMVDVDYLMRHWTVYVVFDNESWIPAHDLPPAHKKGDVVPVPEERRHVYGFSPEYVTVVNRPPSWEKPA